MTWFFSNRIARVEGRVADATRLNWVDRFCPAWSRPWLRLSRADRPAGTWLLLLPCWWGLALAGTADPAGFRSEDAWIALGCALGAFLMRGAGCTWNDITDRNIDAQVARRLGHTLVAPTIRVGCSEHHMGFPGTLTLETSTFQAVLRDYCRSLARHGFETICLLPTHGGNFGPTFFLVESAIPHDAAGSRDGACRSRPVSRARPISKP